jgi:predicted DNA-binding transcriptional regulator AlpA
MTKKPTLPEIGFIRLPLILELIPIGKSTWWAGVKSGKYPKQVKLGENTAAWRVGDIKELIESFNNSDSK